MKCVSLEPPKPINNFIYRCDKRFHVETLKDLYEDHKTYGVVVVKGNNSEYYKIGGTQVTLLNKKQVRISKNQKKGGQSAPRFGRIREGDIKKYISDLSEKCNTFFINSDNLASIDFLTIVGTGDKKDQLYEKLHSELKKICKVVTIPENYDIYEIRKITDNLLENFILDQERIIVNYFFSHIEKETRRAIYGEKTLAEYLKDGNLEKIIIHKNINKNINSLKEKCKIINCEVYVISGRFEQAEKILNFGGIVGISRY